MLIFTIILGLIFCYEFAFKNTWNEYIQFKVATEQQVLIENSTAQLKELASKQIILNSVFDQYQLDTSREDKNLLYVTSKYCRDNSLKLKEYRTFAYSNKDSIHVLTRLITVEGKFIACLKQVYDLELAGKVGKLGSVEFKSYLDPQDKKTKLNCSMYVQNLIPVKNENSK